MSTVRVGVANCVDAVIKAAKKTADVFDLYLVFMVLSGCFVLFWEGQVVGLIALLMSDSAGFVVVQRGKAQAHQKSCFQASPMP